MRHIVCISCGLSSAWVAMWAKKKLPQEKTVYYFNDTKWEHPDLYRFLNDLEKILGIKITYDNDGRSPEDVFYDQHVLGNNRMPVCSRVLKANMLQKFVKDGDWLYFGIGNNESHRAVRIIDIYKRLQNRRKNPVVINCSFPIIDKQKTSHEIRQEVLSLGIEEPLLYKLGFTHNNCSGGCVRAGKKQWIHLLKVLPKVYAERERVETEFRQVLGKPYTYLKDISLKDLREWWEYNKEDESQLTFFDDDKTATECIGICTMEN